MEIEYSKDTDFQWKINWRLEYLGAFQIRPKYHSFSPITFFEISKEQCFSTVHSLLTDTSLKRTPIKRTRGVGPCRTSVIDFISLQGVHLSKVDSRSWSRVGAGPGIWLYFLSFYVRGNVTGGEGNQGLASFDILLPGAMAITMLLMLRFLFSVFPGFARV